MEEDKQYNISMLGNQLSQKFGQDVAYTTVQKCLNNCIVSYKETGLLTREEKFMRNCYIKSYDFFRYADQELRFFIRETKK